MKYTISYYHPSNEDELIEVECDLEIFGCDGELDYFELDPSDNSDLEKYMDDCQKVAAFMAWFDKLPENDHDRTTIWAEIEEIARLESIDRKIAQAELLEDINWR